MAGGGWMPVYGKGLRVKEWMEGVWCRACVDWIYRPRPWVLLSLLTLIEDVGNSLPEFDCLKPSPMGVLW